MLPFKCFHIAADATGTSLPGKFTTIWEFNLLPTTSEPKTRISLQS
jgi:hypothetical protein